MEKTGVLFEPNREKKRFTITIEYFENCYSFSIAYCPDVEVHHHEIIGVLESLKSRYIFDQSMYNRAQLIEEKEDELKSKSEE